MAHGRSRRQGRIAAQGVEIRVRPVMAKAKVAPKKKAGDPAPRVSIRVSIRHGIRVVGRSVRRGLTWWRPILLTTLLVATLGFGAGYFYFVYRPDLQTDKAARHDVIKA